MKYVYICISLVGLGLLYFRPRLRRQNGSERIKWVLKTSNATFETHRYENCSLSTCLRSDQCMLDYTSLSIYIQPMLTVVDEKGDAVTPNPSKEFHMIRSLLKPYSVRDPKEACIVFPGVDFLNLYRFPSLENAQYVAAMISERFYNVLIFTLIGQWSHTFRQIMASSVIPRHMYRHRLDISLPPLLSYSSAKKKERIMKYNLSVLMMNDSAAFKEECLETFGNSQDVKIVSECSDQPEFSCDSNGNRVDWLAILQESKFVLIHERMPLFKTALFRALESTCIPIIFAPNYVLPFADYVDWHLFSLRPSSISRVLDVINSLDENRVQALRKQIQSVFTDFSTLDGILNMTLKVLEARMLPLKARTYDQWNKFSDQLFILPHFEPATQLTLLAHSNAHSAKNAIELIRQFVADGLLSSVTIVWRDEENLPTREIWETDVPVDILTGTKTWRDLLPVVKGARHEALLIVPLGLCHLTEKTIRKALNIWRTVPDRFITISCHSSELEVTIVHKMLFTAAVTGSQGDMSVDTLLDSALNRVCRSLRLITREYFDGIMFLARHSR